MSAETSQTLDRGLQVLQLVATSPTGYSISELSEHFELSRTVVYRLVATLEGHRLVRRSSSGRVTAGLGLFTLGQAVRPALQTKAAPILRALADEVGATAHLTLAEGDEAMAVAVVEPRWSDFHVAYRVGARHRITEAAAGKAIQLGRSQAGQPGRSQAGGAWAVSVGELQPGAHGIAAPVLGLDGLDASVGLVSLHDLDESAIGPRVVDAARAIRRALS